VVHLKELEKIVLDGKKKGLTCAKITDLWVKLDQYATRLAVIIEKIE
jgi:hypothetical protein